MKIESRHSRNPMPIQSMYDIFIYLCLIPMVKVGKYASAMDLKG